MIQQNTLNAVYPLADKLARRGIRLAAYPTTPVDQLVKASHVSLPKSIIPEDPTAPVRELGIDYRILQGSVAKDAMGVCKHDVVMEELVKVISDTVRNNLDLARNRVNPMIKDVAKDVEDYMSAAETVKQTHVSVVPMLYREIWNSPTLGEMVERYGETQPGDTTLSIAVPYDTSIESLTNLAKTGGTRFDEEVVAFINSLGEVRVANIFNAVFGGVPGRSSNLSDVVSSKGDRDAALLVHLFARTLLQDAPEGVKVDLSSYRAYMSNIVALSGRAVVGVMRQRESARVRRQLVNIWPMGADRVGSSPIEIPVNGDVYVQWLKEGGTPEIILGSFVSNQERSYTALLEGAEKYTKEWERVERVLTTSVRLNRFNTAVDGMRMAVAKQINEMDDEVLPVPREILHKRLETALSKLYGKFYEKMHEYARKVVCDTLFPHTNALQILCAIDNVYNDFPEIEVREAALLATIEVVSGWVAKLCKVEFVTKAE